MLTRIFPLTNLGKQVKTAISRTKAQRRTRWGAWAHETSFKVVPCPWLMCRRTRDNSLGTNFAVFVPLFIVL